MNAQNMEVKNVVNGEHTQHSQAANMQTIPSVGPTKLYRVEEIAAAAEISLSYVYALIARNKPRVYARDGRSHLFGQEFLDSIKSMQPRRFRRQSVKVIPRIINKRSSMLPAIDSTLSATQEALLPNTEVHSQTTLLQRIDMLEKKVVELSSFLGV